MIHNGDQVGVLFISYTGLLQPLGQSQVLAYQERLSDERQIHILSFERQDDRMDGDRVAAIRARVRQAGIHWQPLRYHKRFSVLATFLDIAIGAWTGWRLVRRHRLGIIHARSYVPGIMGLVIKRLSGARFVFDMRGFWVDERVDGGIWRRGGWLYRIGKWVERRLLLESDHVVSLTHAGVEEMRRFDFLQANMPAMTVIPTCTDLERFRPMPKPGPACALTLGYVGSAGTWYLFDEAVAAYLALKALRPEARFLIVNRAEHELIRRKLEQGGVDPGDVELLSAEAAAMPRMMARMDVAVFFIKPVFSKLASAPTKLGEFLGCGVPCLSNRGVGDMAKVLEEDRVGVAIADFSPAAVQNGVGRLLELYLDHETRQRCVDAAHRHFSLEAGVNAYRRVYRTCLAPRFSGASATQ